jgi:uncharacterized membrane protein YbhN (UPF0104 family)
VCLGALALVIAGVDLDDRVRLRSGEVLTGEVHEDPEGLRVLRPGQPPRVMLRDEIALAEDGTPDVQLGLRTVWRTSRADLLVLAVLAFVPITFMLGWRFQLVLRTQDIALGYWDAVKLTFAGSFLSFVPFLLGAYGGDVFKAYFVSLHTDRKTEAVTSVVLDRGLGLAGVVVIVGVAAAISPAGSIVRAFLWPMLGLAAAGCLGALVYLWPPFRISLRQSRWADQLRRVDATARQLARHPGVVALCVAVAVVRQLAAFASYLLVALALGMAIGPEDLVEVSACFAAGVAVGAIPISPQGLGTVELAYSVFFADYGTQAQILCLAFGVRLVHLLGTSPGLLVVLTGSYRPPSDKVVREQLS